MSTERLNYCDLPLRARVTRLQEYVKVRTLARELAVIAASHGVRVKTLQKIVQRQNPFVPVDTETNLVNWAFRVVGVTGRPDRWIGRDRYNNYYRLPTEWNCADVAQFVDLLKSRGVNVTKDRHLVLVPLAQSKQTILHPQL